jgi:hypothetical protein
MALNLEFMACKRDREKAGITYVNFRNSFGVSEGNHKEKWVPLKNATGVQLLYLAEN